MAIGIVFETHSASEDNERGRATGWAGESWRQAAARVGRFLADLPLRWDGRRVLVVGHVATRWGLKHAINSVPL